MKVLPISVGIFVICTFGAIATRQAAAAKCRPSTRTSLAIRTDISGSFTDISSTGTALNLSDDGHVAITTTIGNAVFPSGRVVVANNGGIGFGSPPSDCLLKNQGACISSTRAFGGGQALLAGWDDEGDSSGNVFYDVVGGAAIYQWHNLPVGGGATVRFQIKIFGPNAINPPGYAQFIYADIEQPPMSGGAIATIGYQDGGVGFGNLQWSCNSSGSVSNGTVLTFAQASDVELPPGGGN